jgi:hypothetical protein
MAFISGPTTLLGFNPYLKTNIFNIVELGIVIDNVNKIEIIGKKNKIIGFNSSPINKALSKIAATPIILDVAKDKLKVAKTFSNHDLTLNSPMIISLEVLAMKGPLTFPRIESKAGIMRIKIGKLVNFKIKIVRMMPPKRSPRIEAISEGNTSLITFPLVSCFSINHHHQYLKI